MRDPKGDRADFDIEGAVETVDEEDYLLIKLPWRKGASGVTLGVESRESLLTGTWPPMLFDTLSAEDFGDHYRLCLCVLEPIAGVDSRKFFRATIRLNVGS